MTGWVAGESRMPPTATAAARRGAFRGFDTDQIDGASSASISRIRLL